MRSARKSKRWGLWLGSVLLVGAAAVAGVWQLLRLQSPRLRNVIVISIDTLRADHLSYAGYQHQTSPAIDRLARESLDFRNTFAQASTTLPSHATMFTSLYPSVHGAETASKMPLAAGFTTLAERFRDHGFLTAAFVEGGQMARLWSLDQGFDVYDDPTKESDVSGLPDMLDEILRRAKRWIEQHRRERFFCFIHSYVVHTPYWPRPPYDRMFNEGYEGSLPYAVHEDTLREMRGLSPDHPDVRHVVSLYDGEIRYMDELVGKFLDLLGEWKLDQHTVVVFTSDRGEEFAEHGRVGMHGSTLADELLRVPLLIRVPGVKPRVIERQVRLIDLAPTLLALMQIDAGGEALQGDNLLASESAAGSDLPAFGELVYPSGTWSSLRHPQRKIIAGPGGQFLLFDLESDPGEKQNRFDYNRGEHLTLVKEIQGIMARNKDASRHLAVPVELDPQTAAQMRALGYVID